MAGGTSYVSAHEAALIFGLGENSAPIHLEIRWPNGELETLDDVSTNQELVLRQLRKADLKN